MPTAGRCNDPQTLHLVVDGDETLDFALVQRQDAFGYFCQVRTPGYIEANTILPLTGDDVSVPVTLPFTVPVLRADVRHGTRGDQRFPQLPRRRTHPDQRLDTRARPHPTRRSTRTGTTCSSTAAPAFAAELLGSSPDRMFVIEWRNVRYFGDTTRRIDFEVILRRERPAPNRVPKHRQRCPRAGQLGDPRNRERDAARSRCNTRSTKPSFPAPTSRCSTGCPPSGFVQGTVTDANDQQAVAGATVRAMQGGNVVRQATTNGAGFYRMQVRLGLLHDRGDRGELRARVRRRRAG